MRQVTGRAADGVDQLHEGPALRTQEIDEYRDLIARGPDGESEDAARVPCPGDERATLS
ncbi:hypothetical protein ACI798_19700 [Geodermatophilus sp. SYSU D01045]